MAHLFQQLHIQFWSANASMWAKLILVKSSIVENAIYIVDYFMCVNVVCCNVWHGFPHQLLCMIV